jgi:hypothetical protein
MDNGKSRRIGMLKALHGLMNIEISGLRQEQQQAVARLHALEEKLMAMDEEIGAVEGRARLALDPGNNLALEEYQMLLAYLDQKQKLRINNERQKEFAQKRLEKIDGKLAQQGLKIRGVENVLERKLDEQRLEAENKQIAHLDEAWLLRNEEGV